MEFLEKTTKALDLFRDAIYEEGALSKKTKFLIALSNCVALGCEPCMIYRLKAAKHEFNCTDQEIEEAVSIAILNAAGTTQAKLVAAWKKSEQ